MAAEEANTDTGWELVVNEYDKASRNIPLSIGMVFGRDASCSCVFEDPSVSDPHAQIVRKEGRILIEDLGSKNKTRVSGGPSLERGQSHVLEAGMTVQLGRSRIEIRALAGEDETLLAGENTDLTARVATTDEDATVPRPLTADLEATALPDDPGGQVPEVSAEAGELDAGEMPTILPPELTEASPDLGLPPAAKAVPVRSGLGGEEATSADPSLEEPTLQAPVEQASGEQAPGEQAPGEQAPGEQAPGEPKPTRSKPTAPEKTRPSTSPAKVRAVDPAPVQEPKVAPVPSQSSASNSGLSDSSVYEPTINFEAGASGRHAVLAIEGSLRAARARLVLASPVDRRCERIETAEFAIGRKKGVQCRLSHPAISTPHATISFNPSENRFFVRDDGSSNHTYVGSRMIRAGELEELSSNTHLRFGPVDALFVLDVDSEGVKISDRRQQLAAQILVEEEVLTAAQKEEACEQAKSGEQQVGEILLLSAQPITVKQWVDAMERARYLEFSKDTRSFSDRNWAMVAAVLALVLIVLLLRSLF